jgi:hypothetical protein
MEHTQMHPTLKKGTKNFHILEDFFEISIFHEKKIPIVDIKVQVYSKFRKN